MRLTVPITALSAFLCAGAQPQDFASVSGIVVDYTSSAPLPGVHVHLTGESESRGVLVYGAVSDERGRVSFPRVPPGNYMLRPDESARRFFIDTLKSETRRASDLTLKAGDSIEDNLLRVARAGSITGRVIDDDGEPISCKRQLSERQQGSRGERSKRVNDGGPTPTAFSLVFSADCVFKIGSPGWQSNSSPTTDLPGFRF